MSLTAIGNRALVHKGVNNGTVNFVRSTRNGLAMKPKKLYHNLRLSVLV